MIFEVTTIDGKIHRIDEIKGARYYHIPTFYGMQEFELALEPVVSKEYKDGSLFDDYFMRAYLKDNGLINEKS